MYVLADLDSGTVLGFIKMGEKKLFLHDAHGRMKEMSPTCVLDFYVHESQQRKGCGR
jgi:alpha-tubulin N-acetyltransferase 1